MSEETADRYTGMKGDELKAELRARGLKTSGNNTVMADRLRTDDAAPEDLQRKDLTERAEQLGLGDFPRNGTRQQMIDFLNEHAEDDETEEEAAGDPQAQGPNHLPEQADVSPVTTQAWPTVTEHLGPDGEPLPQKHPEPADVAGPGGLGDGVSGDDPDNRARAHLARERADAAYRAGETPGLQMAAIDTTPDNGDSKVLDFPEDGGGFREHTLPVEDRRQTALHEWAEANPHATVIPMDLLPAAYRDPTIATPGLPGQAL